MMRFKRISVFLLSLLSLFLCDLSSPSTSKGFDRCDIAFNKTLKFIKERIKSSLLVKKIQLSCDDLYRINMWQEADVMVTTMRADGKHVICITNNDALPCKYVLSSLTTGGNPNQVLGSIFGLDYSNQGALTETLERLFVRPSKLLLKER